MSFYNKDLNLIYKDLKSSKNGLSSFEAEKRLSEFGQNSLDKPKKKGFFSKLFAQFKNVMIIILIFSAVISLATAILENNSENLFEGILIFVIVIINAIVGVFQEQKAENALESLISSTEPTSIVLRDGKQTKIKSSNLVVGDIVFLKTGNFVPADIRLIDCNNLKCNESSLTGESLPVDKNAKTISQKNLQITEQSNICFSGTSITSGSGTGIVVATGKNSEMGKIAKILSTSIKEKTPLEKNIDKIGKFLTISIVFIVLVVFFVQVFLSKSISVMDALLTAVTLAVAAIPESLPAVITIIMALGVQKLARKNAIVKKLSAVETLGCCTVICSDKTGTLTQNKMTVNHIFFSFKIFNADEINLEKSKKIVEVCALANNAVIEENKINADATETAIVQFLLDKNIDVKNIKNANPKISENEFNSTKKIMSVICKTKDSQSLFSKGAVDYLLSDCKYVLNIDKVEPLTEYYKNRILKENEKICALGERVIALAYSDSANESELIFAGLIGIIDPPRKEAFNAIQECKNAGLKTVMITGDHPETAFAIAKKLSIAKSKKEVLTGNEINKLSTDELKSIINQYSVFARVTPEHKLKIVNAFKSAGHVVAMTGDGINDAPSIKQANIGAAMGITGTDVTKEVADIIIADDNFATLKVAIKEGRTIYQNIAKTILFLLSTNIVEVLGIFVTSLILPNSIFLLPTQILFINLVTDSLPAFALGIEPPEKNIMSKPPRNPNKSLLSGNIGNSIIYQGFIQTLIVLVMFVCAKNFYGDAVASTMSFLTICFMQVIHALNCKTEKSLFTINPLNNKFFNFSFVALFTLILCVYFISPLASLFSLVTITGTQWLIIAITSLSIIPFVEIGKIFIK